MGPDPKDRVTVDQSIMVPEAPWTGERAVLYQILDIKGLPILTSGPHAIYVLSGDEEKARVPLYVREPAKIEGKEVGGSG